MSRVGKRPIELPSNVEAKIEGKIITIKGPKGWLTRKINKGIKVSVEGKKIILSPSSEDKPIRALHGLLRTLISNMVEGVVKGFEKSLEITGVGYKAAKDGKALLMTVGYSHPIKIDPPEGIEFSIEKTKIKIWGMDKGLVGEIAADIRKLREVEPYKAKGIKYEGEVVRRKAGKVAKALAAG